MKTEIDWTELCRGCAKCCGPVPFDVEHWKRVQDRIVNAPDQLMPVPPHHVIPVRNDSFSCVFLTPNLRCAIYEDRPEVCRLQGTIPELPCPRLPIL